MKRKIIRITTIPATLERLLKGQLSYLNQFYEVVAVSGKGPDLQTVKERENVRVAIINMKREISLLNDLHALFRFIFLFNKERPFIVHANTPKGSLLSMLAAKIAKVPHRIYTVTGLRFETEKGLKRWLLITMERLCCRAASVVIPEGNGVRDTMILKRITSKPLNVIGNGSICGVDMHYFSRDRISGAELQRLRDRYWLTGNFVFCFIGRLVKSKGVEELVQAYDNLYSKGKFSRLLIVGTDMGEADSIGWDTMNKINYHPGIVAVGFQQDIRPFLAVSDTLVLPSYREGFPNVVMQAGAMGVPAIVSNISGCNEIVRHRKNGIIVPVRNVTALESAMRYMMEQQQDHKLMAGCSREMIASRFDQHFVWQELNKQYAALGPVEGQLNEPVSTGVLQDIPS